MSPVTDAHPSDTPPDTDSKLLFAENDMMQFECFNKLTSTRGHYYSAPALRACGVWVGYLAPDKHKKEYFGMRSFSDLKTNFADMTLPFPPINEATSARNRNAVCRGCFGQQSALLTLREVHFVHNRKVVVLPLDGDDEVGMFCILLPQAMDRSIKKFQIWRPYEVRNGGDGKKFDNNFVLLSLRDTLQDFGTLEVMRAARDLQVVTPVVVRTASLAATASCSLLGSRKRTTRDSSDPLPRMFTARKRRRLDTPEAQSPIPEVIHRAMTKPAEPQLPQTKRYTPVPIESPHDHSTLTTTMIPESSKARPDDQTALHNLTEQQAQHISIVWKLDVDGDACELPVTLAECRSFREVLQTLRQVAQSLPSAAAILEKSNLWRLAYPLVGGKRRTQMARKGTEVAFDRMRADLVQLSSLYQGMVEVELEALG